LVGYVRATGQIKKLQIGENGSKQYEVFIFQREIVGETERLELRIYKKRIHGRIRVVGVGHEFGTSTCEFELDLTK